MERGKVDFQWVDIAASFPATLVKDVVPERLKDGQTPDAYGLGLDRQGVLYRSAYADTGSRDSTWANIATPTNPPAAGLTWRFKNERLWGYATSGNVLYWGAPGNSTIHFVQGAGSLPVDAENSNLTGVQPFGGMMGAAKAGHLYVIPNADNRSGGFEAGLVGEQGTDAELKMMGLNGNLFMANAQGVWSTDGRGLQELTRPIRENLDVVNGDEIDELRADFAKGRVLGVKGSDTLFVLEPNQSGAGIFIYSGSDFRFTSRSLMGQTGGPIVVDKIGLMYEYAGTSIDVSWQVKLNETWKGVERMRRLSENERGRIELPTNNVLAVRRWAMRLTDIPEGFYIHRIQARIKQEGVLGYATE